MAASSARRTDALCKMLALLLIVPLFNAGVMAQEDDEIITGSTAAVRTAEAYVRGDMLPQTTPASETDEDPQVMILPTVGPLDDQDDQTTAAPADTDAAGEDDNISPEPEQVPADEGAEAAVDVQTNPPKVEPETQPPIPARGDGPNIVPKPVPQDDVVCVSKEAVQDKNAVSLKLKAASTCKETKMKIESVLQELCGEDCKLEIYQEDNTDEIIVSGKYVEDDVAEMANKFNNDNIKDKTDVEEASPRWGKNSKLVLVSLLLTGLLLAALLVAGYYLKTHHKNSKGVRLADTFQVDEENQANTLVSVAPLPQEPLDKPTVNGESPPENGNNPAPTTNGHSATQTPVADTEM